MQEARASIKAAEPVRSRAPLVGLVLAVLAAGTLFALRNKTARPPEPPPAASAPASAAAPPPGPTVPPRFAEPLDVSTFQKGNIHTHTSKSDGDSAPEVVYGWYKSHGYNFLAVTDHNTFTNPKNFGYLEKKGSFVLISGEEITMMGANHQVHVNGLCTHKAIGGKHFDTQGAALAWAVAEVRAQGGVSLVNHPNWDWALTEKDIPSARGASLLEISSGHPFVRTDGDETHKSHEAIWDHALSHGEVLAGAAVDDSHYFKPYVKKKEDEPKARPGRAWVEVFAEVPERDRICEALGKGRLYASTGVKLKRITVDATTYTLAIEDKDAEVTFVGREGRVLQKGKAGDDGKASYTLRGGEGYVRAKVVTPDGAAAWTQPSFLVQETPEKEGPPALLKPEELAPVKPGASATPLLPGH
ncbi:MAG: CehA/McbA family metallohydrolase [Byssovorax sp.]